MRAEAKGSSRKKKLEGEVTTKERKKQRKDDTFNKQKKKKTGFLRWRSSFSFGIINE